MTAANPEFAARIARLFVYPVKSCAGIEVTEAVLTDTGLDLDRAWMVVDEQGTFVSQRELPRMALVRTQLKRDEVVLRAPGMLALHLAIDEVEGPARVRVWDDEVSAYDMGAVAAQWFSDFLGRRLRLVRFDPEQRRLSSLKWTGGVEAPNQFADAFPLLVASEASLAGLNERLASAGQPPVGIERFRPNIVLAGVRGARRGPRGGPAHRGRQAGRHQAGQALRALPDPQHRPADRRELARGARHAAGLPAGPARGRRRDVRDERDRAGRRRRDAAGGPARERRLEVRLRRGPGERSPLAYTFALVCLELP